MAEIVQSVGRVTDFMAEITAASQEQTAGIEQINSAVTQMDQVTQQNAALVEQASAAAQSLQEEANALAQAVGTFRLDAQAAPARPVKAAARIDLKTAAPAPKAAKSKVAAEATEGWEQF